MQNDNQIDRSQMNQSSLTIYNEYIYLSMNDDCNQLLFISTLIINYIFPIFNCFYSYLDIYS